MILKILKHHLIKFQSRPLSWSSIASWQFSRDQWARKYLEGIYEEPNNLMLFGNEVGQKLGLDRKYLPMVERYEVMYPAEHRLTSKINDIELVGLFDSFDPKDKHFNEYKTSSNKTKWTQKSAQGHGQILFYLFLIYKNYNIPPEKIKVKLYYIPVSTDGDFKMKVDEKGIQSFEVKHTSLEVLKFANFIKQTYQEMSDFALGYLTKE